YKSKTSCNCAGDGRFSCENGAHQFRGSLPFRINAFDVKPIGPAEIGLWDVAQSLRLLSVDCAGTEEQKVLGSSHPRQVEHPFRAVQKGRQQFARSLRAVDS